MEGCLNCFLRKEGYKFREGNLIFSSLIPQSIMNNLLGHHTFSKWYLPILLCLWSIVAAGCNQGAASTHDEVLVSSDHTNTFLPAVRKPVTVPSEIRKIDLPLKPTDILINPQTGNVYILAGRTHVVILKEESLSNQYALLQIEGTNADQMILDTSKDRVYVAHDYEGQGSITIIQDDEILSRLDVPIRQIQDLTVHPDTHELYIVGTTNVPENSSRAELIVTNGSEILRVVDIGEIIPTRIVIDPVFNYIYIGGFRLGTNQDGSFIMLGTLIVVNETGTIQELELGQAIVDIDMDSNTGDAYILHIPSYDNETRQEDLTLIRDGNVITSIQVADKEITAQHLRVHPTTTDIYIINPASEQVSVVRNTGDQLEIVGNIGVGSGAGKLAIDPDTENVYITNFNDNTVSVLNGNQIVATLEVGWYPYGIAVNPQNGWVYVSNTNERTVLALGYDD